MTRKDYILLAAAFKAVKPEGEQLKQWFRDVKAIALACKDENPHFKRELFFNACGCWEEEGEEEKA